MNKLIGYIIAVVGLLVIAVSMFNLFSIPGIAEIKPVFITLAGVIIVIVGVFLTFGKETFSREKQAEKEVPIYAGTGKHRKIVGYKREE